MYIHCHGEGGCTLAQQTMVFGEEKEDDENTSGRQSESTTSSLVQLFQQPSAASRCRGGQTTDRHYHAAYSGAVQGLPRHLRRGFGDRRYCTGQLLASGICSGMRSQGNQHKRNDSLWGTALSSRQLDLSLTSFFKPLCVPALNTISILTGSERSRHSLLRNALFFTMILPLPTKPDELVSGELARRSGGEQHLLAFLCSTQNSQNSPNARLNTGKSLAPGWDTHWTLVERHASHASARV